MIYRVDVEGNYNKVIILILTILSIILIIFGEWEHVFIGGWEHRFIGGMGRNVWGINPPSPGFTTLMK